MTKRGSQFGSPFREGIPEFRRPADRRHRSPMRPAVFLSHCHDLRVRRRQREQCEQTRILRDGEAFRCRGSARRRAPRHRRLHDPEDRGCGLICAARRAVARAEALDLFEVARKFGASERRCAFELKAVNAAQYERVYVPPAPGPLAPTAG